MEDQRMVDDEAVGPCALGLGARLVGGVECHEHPPHGPGGVAQQEADVVPLLGLAKRREAIDGGQNVGNCGHGHTQSQQCRIY
ncbi:MAG: hypothetical protein NTY65_09290 [Planctomycetota bacterium]|nr:hypothetical protein [Planctomycetota bacterium]